MLDYGVTAALICLLELLDMKLGLVRIANTGKETFFSR
jgi:hypothetical protein